jgi:hypothetical protein
LLEKNWRDQCFSWIKDEDDTALDQINKLNSNKNRQEIDNLKKQISFLENKNKNLTEVLEKSD